MKRALNTIILTVVMALNFSYSNAQTFLHGEQVRTNYFALMSQLQLKADKAYVDTTDSVLLNSLNGKLSLAGGILTGTLEVPLLKISNISSGTGSTLGIDASGKIITVTGGSGSGAITGTGIFNSMTGRIILIGQAMPDANYKVSITITSDSDGSVGEIFIPQSLKTTTQFVVKNTGSNSTFTFDWIVNQ